MTSFINFGISGAVVTWAAVAGGASLLSSSMSSGAPDVRVGYCTGLKGLDAAKAAGFEYVELSATEIASLSDADFDAAAAKIKALGIPTPTANLFVPATIKLTGPDVHPDEQMAHVHKALTRLARLGTEIVVFGSARDPRASGITIAIEPLRKQETNIINTAAEGLELVKAIGDPNFELMIDFYHLASEHEDPSIVVTAKDHLRHLHMANPQGRVFPQKWDEFDYAPFFEKLRAIGYDKRISVEASTTDLATQGPQAIALLHRAFEEPK
jgi:D-psicose/D-tagatose/L-ribulose 3-epimerase